MIFILLFQEGAVLEYVGIQFAFVGGIIGQQRTAKANQLHVQAIFLFGHPFGDFCYVLLGAVNDANLDMVLIDLLIAPL
ncbi:hypothetical protein D3C72_2019640 [compost metagenome]